MIRSLAICHHGSPPKRGMKTMSSNCRPMPCCWPRRTACASRHFASPASRSIARSFIRSSIAPRMLERVIAYPGIRGADCARAVRRVHSELPRNAGGQFAAAAFVEIVFGRGNDHDQ